MGSYLKKIVPLFFVCASIVLSYGFKAQKKSSDLQTEVARIFKKSCSVSGCHSGKYPPLNLSLEEDKYFNILVNTASQERKELKLVDTVNPEKSYLLMKIKGNKDIVGNRMPANSPPLEEEEISTIEGWILSLKGKAQVEKKQDKAIKTGLQKPDFWGTRLINLPTTRSIGKGDVLFRISHRYFPAVKDGYDTFFGLDGPAAILLSLGYGLTDNFSFTLARSNRFKEIELSIKWTFLEQGKIQNLPFSAALNFGGSLVTQSQPGKKIWRSENVRMNLQLSLSHKLNDSLSFLLVPSYSSNANQWEVSSEGTFALGTGVRFSFTNDLSLLLEWMPVLSGYKANSSGWGLGLEKKIGGHVFQVFVLNTPGLTSPQYLPGGDFCLKNSEFRLGFNIFRWF